jgi:HPt (histidine-containing phosphotransfer) domain-containing protein
MSETELLDMLAAETDRRSAAIIEGVESLAQTGESAPERVEALRVEAHGLKGAALVVGQPRLAELAMRIEDLLAARMEAGTIDVGLAAKLIPATSALHEGAEAAADGSDEPPSVGTTLESLA